MDISPAFGFAPIVHLYVRGVEEPHLLRPERSISTATGHLGTCDSKGNSRDVPDARLRDQSSPPFTPLLLRPAAWLDRRPFNDAGHKHRRISTRPTLFAVFCPVTFALSRLRLGLPQAKRIQHSAKSPCSEGSNTTRLTPVSLEAFLHEYRITFPVGVDAHDPGVALPITMGRYCGAVRACCHRPDRTNPLNAFGQVDDLRSAPSSPA